ncbi:hypothetical protein ACOME3_002953 [Neoechinorhynchus agilis]
MGLFRAELNEFFKRELSAQDGFSGIDVRRTPNKYEIIIKATRSAQVVGEKGRRIRELSSVLAKRFRTSQTNIDVLVGKVECRGLCAVTQAESLRYKLTEGVAVRRACYGVLRFIMDAGARGCEITVSGKLRGQRAKSMKFIDGLMIHSGNPVRECVRIAVRHVLLRQGMLGIKVKIMLPFDKTNRFSVEKPLPDHVSIVEPKESDQSQFDDDQPGCVLKEPEQEYEEPSGIPEDLMSTMPFMPQTVGQIPAYMDPMAYGGGGISAVQSIEETYYTPSSQSRGEMYGYSEQQPPPPHM